MNITLCGKRDLNMWLRILRRGDQPRSSTWTLHVITRGLRRRQQEGQREAGPVVPAAGTVWCSHSWGRWAASGRNQPCWHHDFSPVKKTGFRTVRKYINMYKPPNLWYFVIVATGNQYRLSRVFSNTTVQKHQFFGTQLSLTSIHDHWKNHSFD